MKLEITQRVLKICYSKAKLRVLLTRSWQKKYGVRREFPQDIYWSRECLARITRGGTVVMA
jgi:hypothetical protein